jgi:hypothetical protein
MVGNGKERKGGTEVPLSLSMVNSHSLALSLKVSALSQ